MAPLQLYFAGTLFSPKLSSTRTQFSRNAPTYLSIDNGEIHDWGAMQQILECEDLTSVHRMMFSENAEFLVVLASTSEPSAHWNLVLNLFHVELGQCLLTVEHKTDASYDLPLVAFTDRDSTILLADHNGIVLRWKVTTGDELGHFDHAMDAIEWKAICCYTLSPALVMYQSRDMANILCRSLDDQLITQSFGKNNQSMSALAYHTTAGMCAVGFATSVIKFLELVHIR